MEELFSYISGTFKALFSVYVYLVYPNTKLSPILSPKSFEGELFISITNQLFIN